MSKQEPKSAAAEVDADGLAIQKYKSLVLVVVPPTDFGDECLRYARSSLFNVHVGTKAVSLSDRDVKGRLQDEFLVDGTVAGERMESYSGVIFAGGEGAATLAADSDVLRIAREACQQKKLVGAWGHAILILARAGVLAGRKVTGHAGARAEVERAGGKFTGRQIERDGSLVTAADDAAGMRFGKALAAIVGI